MKLKSLFLALLVMFSGVVMAQVESGKVYRIVSAKYNTVITANPITHRMTCVAPGGNEDYWQLWEFVAMDGGKYAIKNVLTGLYVQGSGGQNSIYLTESTQVPFKIVENPELPGKYNIDNNDNRTWGLHCDSGSKIVPWTYGPDDDGKITGTEWTFQEMPAVDYDKVAQVYKAYNAVHANKDAIVAKVNALFEDKTGLTLKSQYASMEDDALVAAMDGVPAELQQAVLKVKNGTWATVENRPLIGEKNFRVHDYKPYSDTDQWKHILYHRPFNRINNPTGICSESELGYIYVFVEKIPTGSEIFLSELNGTKYHAGDETSTRLVPGLNIIPSAHKDGVIYVRYVVDTHTGFNAETKSGSKKLKEYPTVKVHIEGGYVNGFWSKERGHTNADWVYMGKNMFRNEAAVQAVGDHSMLNFRKKEFLLPYQYVDAYGFKVEGCHTDIETVMKFWDFWNERQRYYMGLDKYYEYFNNKQLAMSDDSGFMDAGEYRTHYNNNTLTTIVNIDRISRDGGSAWGPLHEIGHTNQYAFELVGTSEVSNNALANFTIFDTGTHTSRGWNMDAQIKDFENKVPYVVRGESRHGSELFGMTRMYFQLFLYFHAAKKKEDFYPVLFEELRKDKLVGWSTRSQCNGNCNDGVDDPVDPATGYVLGSMNAKYDQLKFVEKCCSIAQMDLTEFFEAWGFFVPMENEFVGDYGHHHVYLTQEDIDECIAGIKAKNYPKKGGHLMFLEDRIRHSKQIKSILNENPSGYRLDYSDEVIVDEVNYPNGEFGQWEDYVDEGKLATGYYYSMVGQNITILEDNASGALGFKLYDKETGKLLTYSNRRSLKVPVSYMDRELRIVAAQANGEDAEVLPAAQGPAEMQKSALANSLEEAWYYVNFIATNGSEIGFFNASAVNEMEELYAAAEKALNDEDTSLHSYADWSAMLDNERKRIDAMEGARIMLEEGDKVKLQVIGKGYLQRNVTGIKPVSGADGVETLWTAEYAGNGEYYLMCDGKYIADYEIGDVVMCNQTTLNANVARFTVKYYSNGLISLVSGDKALGLSSADEVIGVSALGEVIKLKAFIQESNSAQVYKEELDKALLEAGYIITEVMKSDDTVLPAAEEEGDDETGTATIFNDNIIVRDINLESYVLELYNVYCQAMADIDNANKHKSYLTSLRKLIARIENTYVVKSPIDVKNNSIPMYRLYDTNKEQYLGIVTSQFSGYKDRLTEIKEGALDDNALWAFLPTGGVNEYKMYNVGAGAYVTVKGTKKTQLFTVKNEEPVAVVLDYDMERNAVVLRANGKNVVAGSTYVDLNDSKEPACWVLDLALIEQNEDLYDYIVTRIENMFEEGNYNEEFYDLHGRRVVNPTKGIYIQNGKKVYYK